MWDVVVEKIIYAINMAETCFQTLLYGDYELL